MRAFLELGLGYDTNVNSATSRSAIAIPAFGGAIGQLSPNAQQQESWFAGVGAGASIDQALSDEWSLLGAASYAGKFNQDYNEFNTGTLDGSAGVRWSRGANQLVGLAQGQMFWLDNQRYRELYGGTVQWLHNLSPTQQLTVFGQFSALRYPQASQSPQDANRGVGGVAYAGDRGVREVEFSVDDGKTWQRHGPIAVPDRPAAVVFVVFFRVDGGRK